MGCVTIIRAVGAISVGRLAGMCRDLPPRKIPSDTRELVLAEDGNVDPSPVTGRYTRPFHANVQLMVELILQRTFRLLGAGFVCVAEVLACVSSHHYCPLVETQNAT